MKPLGGRVPRKERAGAVVEEGKMMKKTVRTVKIRRGEEGMVKCIVREMAEIP